MLCLGGEIGRGGAGLIEQALPAGCTHAGMGQIDMHLGHFVFIAGAADQEGLHRMGQGHIGRVPAITGEEQVLALVKAEQRQRGKAPGLPIAAEDNGIVRGNRAKFRWHDQASHHPIAPRHPGGGGHGEIAMAGIVEQGVAAAAGHGAGVLSLVALF